MKNLIIFGLFILVLVCAQFAQGQTVDGIINKHIAALGGRETLNRIRSVVMHSSMNLQGAEIGSTLTQVNNKLNGMDISAIGMDGFDMLSEKDGWKYMPFQGMQKPEPEMDDAVRKSQIDIDIAGPLVDYAAKGHKAELLGKEEVEGIRCYKIKLTLAGGKELMFFIDPASSMIIRIKENRKFNGQDTELQTDLSDYKDVEGVKMPHVITRPFGTVLISGIKINQTIPGAAFKNDI